MSNHHTLDSISAYNACIDLLARREYSQQELRQKLTQKGADNEVIDTCLERLINENYQSDQRFTEMFVRTRVGQRYGPRKIHYELQQKGIETPLATAETAKYLDDILDNAQLLIERKAPRGDIFTIFNDRKLKEKVTRFLVGRGYEYDTINLAFEIVQENL